jgi:nitrate/TMAO reductase-like tetraheme cytochrome c subunit
MVNPVTRKYAIAVVASAAALAHSQALWADRESFRVDNTTYKSECGSCHVAYPPALLPARSWQAIVDGLDQHFGTNAAIDDKSRAEIRAFLLKNAGRDRSNSATPILRITQTPWFKREHREVPASIWSSAKVKSPSNCGACHQGADDGNFEESSISIPK